MAIIPDDTRSVNVNNTTKIVSLKEERGTSASQRGNASSFSPNLAAAPTIKRSAPAATRRQRPQVATKPGRIGFLSTGNKSNGEKSKVGFVEKVGFNPDSYDGDVVNESEIEKSKSFLIRHHAVSVREYEAFESLRPPYLHDHDWQLYKHILLSMRLRAQKKK